MNSFALHPKDYYEIFTNYANNCLKWCPLTIQILYQQLRLQCISNLDAWWSYCTTNWMKLNLTSCSYSYKFHLYNLKTHSSVFIDLENKITWPYTSVSCHKRIKSFHLIIISREFITFMYLSSDDWDKLSISTDSPMIFIFYTHKESLFWCFGIS